MLLLIGHVICTSAQSWAPLLVRRMPQHTAQVDPSQLNQFHGKKLSDMASKVDKINYVNDRRVERRSVVLNGRNYSKHRPSGYTTALLVLTRTRRLFVWRAGIRQMESYNFLCMSSLKHLCRHRGECKLL